MFFSLSNNSYVAIIGDIKNSRKILDRKEVQNKLKQILNEINDKYNSDISSKFILTLGDEFQGLLGDGNNALNIVSEIERRMYPIRIRFGIGIGQIHTDINKEMALGADGPGYHKARSAIEYLKENEKKKQAIHSNIRIEVESDSQETAMMLNTILALMTSIEETWSDRQREIIWDMLEHQDSQLNVAKRLNIQQPAVQKSLSKGKYYAYKNAFDTIGKALKDIRRDDV